MVPSQAPWVASLSMNVSDMELHNLEEFYKIHAKFYDWTRPWFLFDRKKAIERLDVHAGDNVIDCACGTGLNIPMLLRRKAHVTGTDYSSSMLQRAKKKYPSIQFVQGDIATYQFDERADRIICTYSLSMVAQWEKAIENMQSTLKKDGRLVILDFHHPWRGFRKILYPLFRWWLRKHEVDPEKQIVPCLKKHFENVQVHAMRCGYNFIAVATAPYGCAAEGRIG